jgi:gluconolactonase
MPIEWVSPDLERVVFRGDPIEELADGFGNENGPAEGPIWWQEGGYLLFSDIGDNRRMKWAPDRGQRSSKSQQTTLMVSLGIFRAG